MRRIQRTRNRRIIRKRKMVGMAFLLTAICAILCVGGWYFVQTSQDAAGRNGTMIAAAQSGKSLENSPKSESATTKATEVLKATDAPKATTSPQATSTPSATTSPKTSATPMATSTQAAQTAKPSEEVVPANPIGQSDEEPGLAPVIPANAEELADEGENELRLSGVKIGIDPGHQAKGNNEKEPVAPGSKEKKAKVASGTSGVKTRRAEHEVDLEISLKLRDALEAEGAEVYMTRETADVDISNVERAQMMNELDVDLVLRLHCNGSTKKSVNGIGLYVRKTGAKADECSEAAELLLPALIDATGARNDGIHRNDTYSGLNWSEVPSILVEMGYMSNPDEDVRLSTPEYQDKLVSGMVEGIYAYCVLRTDSAADAVVE